ncbi:Glyoxalase-like domain protein [Streptomyces sp. YIM 121038]|uniref:VOC family protein n=1 Tax=Streptomyces sp. YIM 121038 TaxID=2136401 RepID=UPI001110C48F|nr:VOC family protein [Streptomyces sp. YIM 121038]QCX76183.1 Glyoxalase-like domain protein [Streptomyces sp. YIM 121038]
MEWTLEVVTLPVADLDRAKDFYETKCGFKADLDSEVAPGVRVIQITPPGSRCSFAMVTGLPLAPGQDAMAPGSLQGLQLCVTDIEAARAELAGRGVDVTPVRTLGARGWEDGRGDAEWSSFCFFKDPDGNGWTVQEAPAPLAHR